ncbi:MAG: NAD(P)/FAD-dependent oxidoreductase [Cyclobacteriaceae bacterium]
MSGKYDTVITGSGPNGLSAAIYLQQQGLRTLVLEGKPEPGGSTRTAEATLPGFYHDIGSAVHPLALASPYLSRLPLNEFGLEWIHPELPLAHPMRDGRVVTLYKDIDRFAETLGDDGEMYKKLIEPLVSHWDRLSPELLSPLKWPSNPFLLARFGLRAFWSASFLNKKLFKNPDTRTFFSGLAAHSGLPLDATASSAFGLVLAATAHAVNWPVPKGGAQGLAKALVGYYKSLGGELRCNETVKAISDLPDAKSYIFDVTPTQLLAIDGLELSSSYRKKLERFEYGPGIFKIDLALNEPIPWHNPECGKAGTIHLGTTADEIATSEAGLGHKVIPENPYVILSQPTLLDPSRAPEGKHIAWAYCHVPNGSDADMYEPVIKQIEKVALGFRDTILHSSTMNCSQMEAWNPNLVGGDVNGGLQKLGQLFFRPVAKLKPYRTSVDNVYMCSSSTPPGGGVHGMCGYHAAKTVFEDHFS